jgi:hypothetical protein
MILAALNDGRRTGTTHHWRVLARPCRLAWDAASGRPVRSKAMRGPPISIASVGVGEALKVDEADKAAV